MQPTSFPPIQPVALSISPSNSLQIEWSDGRKLDYPLRTLRDACPCATCKEKKRAEQAKKPNPLMVLSERETVPLAITAMKPVGNYAYNIAFSDGHTSGLFTMDYLREIGALCD